MPAMAQRPAWWGGSRHVKWTITVFVVLASLDNAALAIVPGMIPPLRDSLRASETALGVLTGTSILVTALAAAGWGFWGDRSRRKRLLFGGTLLWAAACTLSATATSFAWLYVWQTVMAVGLGAIASVGFSVVSDLVRPARRGLAMSFWGVSQGIGTVGGQLIASQLGADRFGTPFVVVGVAGVVFALAYLVAYDVPRGFREPVLAAAPYDYRIEARQIPGLWAVRTNRWLILQGFSAQFAYGSLVWTPLLYQEKVLAAGYGTDTATKVGGIFATLNAVGALASIIGGHVGDRWQARDPRGRALLSTIGILGAIPLFLVFFFVPLRGLEVTDGAGTWLLLRQVLAEVVTNPWVGAALATGILALVLTSVDSPNAFALIADVNLPEHRGTVFGAGNLANGLGRATGSSLASAAATAMERSLPPPANWAAALAAFQLFFLPTGYCYWRASHTSPEDVASLQATLAQRATGAGDDRAVT
jgi:MFS family permease